MLESNPPHRFCPRCSAGENIAEDQPVWPLEWHCSSCGSTIETRDGIPLLASAVANSVDEMDPALFQSLAHWESNNFWFVPRNRLVTNLVNRYFPSAKCFMEIGCGNGFVLSAISQLKPWFRLVGAELHPEALLISRLRLGSKAELVQMDARTIPAANAFDVIGAFDVLEHIEDDNEVLLAMHRALRCGGGIVLAVPQHPWLWSKTDEVAHHKRRYRRGELESKVRAAGFHVLFSTSYTALLLPLLVASRLTSVNTENALRREFELPQFANGVLKAILSFEVMLTLAGLRFPAGGSRVVVAAKVSGSAGRLPSNPGTL